MEYKRYFWIKVILLPAIVTGIDFTFSKQKVLLGSEGTLTMTCDITETDVDSVYLFQIRRLISSRLSGSDPTDWTTLVVIEPGTSDSPSLDQGIVANTKDYVAGGSWDSNSPSDAVLTLSMNIQKLVCDDARYYICELTYKSSTTQALTLVRRNGTFTAYVKPQVTSLITKYRNLIQESSEINPAAVNVGDQLKLRCTANIGSSPSTFIRWHRTSKTASTNEFICYQPPPGTFDDGTAVSDNQCGYYREATITNNATDFDANRENNLAFECYVTVSGDPYGTSYTSENNPRFYADVTDPVTGINFSFDKERVLLGSTGTLTMTCDITETGVESVYLIQIMRIKSTSLSGEEKSHWDTLALMEISTNESPTLDNDITASTKDYVAEGSWDSTTPGNTYLTVSMNMEKLVCDDARYYKCELSYKSSTSDINKSEMNATFSAYVMPQVTSLDVRKNSFIVQGSSPTDLAAVDVGDELGLTCTANIGSLPGTKIRWHKTSETASTNEFISYQPPQGTYDEGTAISDNQCGYIRVAVIKYNATVADANRYNLLAFECYVTVTYGNSYTSENNPRFYADVTGPGAPATQSSLKTSGAYTTETSHRTSGDGQISVSLGVIVGIVIASVTVGVVIGVVFTWVFIHKIKNVQGPGVQIQPNREESREMSSVIKASTTQSPYESLEHGTGTSHTYAGLQQSG